jgi:hypothetical protein
MIKRFASRGITDILIVAPNDKIIEDWQKSGKLLDLDITRLKADVMVNQEEKRSRAPSLSATSFAYEKNVEFCTKSLAMPDRMVTFLAHLSKSAARIIFLR